MYTILASKEMNTLITMVDNFLNENADWIPIGNVNIFDGVDGDIYGQALYKPMPIYKLVPFSMNYGQ